MHGYISKIVVFGDIHPPFCAHSPTGRCAEPPLIAHPPDREVCGTPIDRTPSRPGGVRNPHELHTFPTGRCAQIIQNGLFFFMMTIACTDNTKLLVVLGSMDGLIQNCFFFCDGLPREHGQNVLVDHTGANAYAGPDFLFCGTFGVMIFANLTGTVFFPRSILGR